MAALAAALAAASPLATAQTAAPADTEWPVYGGSLLAQHYAPLAQIDASNFEDLEIAWRWSAANFGPSPETRSETTPLMLDGVLYATAGQTRNVVAIDGAPGETLWMWRPDEGERFRAAPRRLSGRGVAHWSDGQGDDRIFTVTPGFVLVALDAASGRPKREFGEAGFVDMQRFIRGPADNIEIGSSSPITSGGDVIVVGPAGGIGARPNSKGQTKSTFTLRPRARARARPEGSRGSSAGGASPRGRRAARRAARGRRAARRTSRPECRARTARRRG
jgi:quinoprotein glucose dehydrogenase